MFRLFKKKEIVYLRSVIRNPEIKKNKRLRIFKKYLRNQKKDFDDNIALQQEKNDKEKKELKSINFEKVSFKRKFLSFLLVILSLAFSSLYIKSVVDMIGIEFLKTINEGIQELGNIFLGVMIITNVLTIGNFIYLLYFSIANRKHVKTQQRMFRSFEKYLDNARKAIKKCYKRVSKYYKKQILSDSFMYEALTLDELWDLNVNYDEEDLKKEEAARNNKRIVKRNKHYKPFSKLLMTGSVIFLIGLIGLLAYVVIKTLL